jgi:hypothetical protein
MSYEHKNKTLKNSYGSLDMSGALALGISEKTFQLLSQDAENALKRPWHKLERGLRIGRLREYVSRETQKMSLNEEDADILFKLLCKGLDTKMLSSKAAVTYDFESEKITEIKGLVAHSQASGRTKYQLLEKKVGTTQKKRTKDSPTSNSDGRQPA